MPLCFLIQAHATHLQRLYHGRLMIVRKPYLLGPSLLCMLHGPEAIVLAQLLSLLPIGFSSVPTASSTTLPESLG